MRIRKISQVTPTPTESHVINGYSESTTDTYSCNYVNSFVNTYSTSEQRIGTWVDNKPIYRKCIYMSSFPNAGTKVIDVSALNIDYIVNTYGFARNSSGNGFPINNSRPENNGATIGVYLDSTLRVITSSDRSAYAGYIIIEYTKTTD